MIVTIPSRQEHEGIYAMTIEISDFCPICGGPRGVPIQGLSYDGNRPLNVSIWSNPCGHVDYYSRVREEYKQSVINKRSQKEVKTIIDNIETAPGTDTGYK